MGHTTNSSPKQTRRPSAPLVIVCISVVSSVALWILQRIFPLHNIEELFGLSPDYYNFTTHLWGLVTYIFAHNSVFHLGINMVFMYIFAEKLARYTNTGSILNTFFFGGILGGLLYVTGYQILRAIGIAYRASLLLGSSAAVMALFIAWAYSTRKEDGIKIFRIILSYKTIANILTALLVANLIYSLTGGKNSLSDLAHLGGIIAGLIAHNFMKNQASEQSKDETDEKSVSAILNKVKLSGYASLTKQEKEKLLTHENSNREHTEHNKE